MRTDMEIKKLTNNWFEKNMPLWNKQGFELINHKWSENRTDNSIEIEIHKGNIMSSITIWESGACDFLQIYKDKDIKADNKYFKNVILKTEQQLNWELDNFFCNYESLGGSSVDPIHHSEKFNNTN
jgi:hypothetical protein